MADRSTLTHELNKVDIALRAVKEVLSGSDLESVQTILLARRQEIMLAMIEALAKEDTSGSALESQLSIVPEGQSAGPSGFGRETSIPPQSTAAIHPVSGGLGEPLDIQDQATALKVYLAAQIEAHAQKIIPGFYRGNITIRVDLERIFFSRSALDQTPSGTELRPELTQPDGGIDRSLVTTSVALRRYSRLVVLGGPGSGKTTLLAYLALTCARSRQDGTNLLQQRLQLDIPNLLPVWVDLSALAAFLQQATQPDNLDSLAQYLRQAWAAQNIQLPEGFFELPLAAGDCFLLFDGLNEVPDLPLRTRILQLVDTIARQCPGNRIVLASREAAYPPSTRLEAGFGLVQLRPFSRIELSSFVRNWTDVVEVARAGQESRLVLTKAEDYAENLLGFLNTQHQLAGHLSRPLALSLAALVHRHRSDLPLTMAGLLQAAVAILFGPPAPDAPAWELDQTTRHRLLMRLALDFQVLGCMEMSAQELHQRLAGYLERIQQLTEQDGLRVDQFQTTEWERSGILVQRSTGSFGFVHAWIQEFLAAEAIVQGESEVVYTLEMLENPWWRETILFQASLLGIASPERAAHLIKMLLEIPRPMKYDPAPVILLVADCLAQIGANQLPQTIVSEVQRQTQRILDAPVGKGSQTGLKRKLDALEVFERIRSQPAAPRLWKLPWGEPEWSRVHAGDFWMGSEDQAAQGNERLLHQVRVGEYYIARIPVTNAQYALYVADSGAPPPDDWPGGKPAPEREHHPVVHISWHDALAYCRWLSEKTRQNITLPSEAEWEKAARGDRDQRLYPWGDVWEELYCNSSELGLDDTSPVGMLPMGASPFQCLDMAGNIWEWTRSLVQSYPYISTPDRESLSGDHTRVLRGGAFDHPAHLVRCSTRNTSGPHNRARNIGFRVISLASDSFENQQKETAQSWQGKGSLLSRTRS